MGILSVAWSEIGFRWFMFLVPPGWSRFSLLLSRLQGYCRFSLLYYSSGRAIVRVGLLHICVLEGHADGVMCTAYPGTSRFSFAGARFVWLSSNFEARADRSSSVEAKGTGCLIRKVRYGHTDPTPGPTQQVMCFFNCLIFVG